MTKIPYRKRKGKFSKRVAKMLVGPRGGKLARKRPRKHNPELLRFKRAARAMGIDWGDVCQLRDKLRAREVDDREQSDALHKAATLWFGGEGAAPFWRGFFKRKFDKLIRDGGDHTSVKGFDLFVQANGRCGERHCLSDEALGSYDANGFGVDEAWEILCEERPPLKPIWEHYDTAIRMLAAAELGQGDTPF